MFYCYTISDTSGVVRYVGKGTRGRFRKNIDRRSDAIKSLIESDMTLPAVIVRDGLTERESFDMERELIAIHKRECDGGTLVNKALGGKGAPGVKRSAESNAKTSAALTGRERPTEHREALSAALKGRRPSDACMVAAVTTNSGRKPSAATIAKRAAALRGRKRGPMSDETRAKLSVTMRGKPWSAARRLAQETQGVES